MTSKYKETQEIRSEALAFLGKTLGNIEDVKKKASKVFSKSLKATCNLFSIRVWKPQEP